MYTDYVRAKSAPQAIPQLAISDAKLTTSADGLNGTLACTPVTTMSVLNWVSGRNSVKFAVRSTQILVFRSDSTAAWRVQAQILRLAPLGGNHACIAGSRVRISIPEPIQSYFIGEAVANTVDEARYLSLYTGLTPPEQTILAQSPIMAEGQWGTGLNGVSHYTLVSVGNVLNTSLPLVAPGMQDSLVPDIRKVIIPASLNRFGLADVSAVTVQTSIENFFDGRVARPPSSLQVGDETSGFEVSRKPTRDAVAAGSSMIYFGDDLTGVVMPKWPAQNPLPISGAFSWPSDIPVTGPKDPEDARPRKWPCAILKSTETPPLRSLFFGAGAPLEQLRKGNAAYWDLIKDLIGDETSAGKLPDNWTGMVFFGAKLSSNRGDVNALIQPDAQTPPVLAFHLLAISSGVDSASGLKKAAGPSVSAARLSWISPATAPGTPASSLQLTDLKATVLSDTLEDLSIKAVLNIDKIFGLEPDGAKARQVNLAGSFAKSKDQLDLRAAVKPGVLSFGSKTDPAFEKRLIRFGEITSLKVGYVDQRPALKLSIGGLLKVGTVPYFDGLTGKDFAFEDLELISKNFASPSSGRVRRESAALATTGWMELAADYAKVKIESLGQVPLINAGPLQVKMDKVRFVQGTSRQELIATEGMVPLTDGGAGTGPSPFAAQPAAGGLLVRVLRWIRALGVQKANATEENIWLQLSVHWAPKPSWAEGALNLRLRLGVGSPTDRVDLFYGVGTSDLIVPKISLGKIASFGFDKLEFSTYQVIGDPHRYPYFVGTDFQLALFGQDIVDNLSGLFYCGPGVTAGTLLSYSADQPSRKAHRSNFKLEWLVAGQNAYPAAFSGALDDLTKLEAKWNPDKSTVVTKAVNSIYADPTDYLVNSAGAPMPGWVFGFGLSLSGLQCTVLVVENLGGVALFYGKQLAKLLPITQLALYYYAATAERPERFGISVALAKNGVSIGCASVTGGIITVEWSPNGSFLIDVGYPWAQPGSVRQWGRALTLWFGVIQMSGGFYLELRKSDDPAADSQAFSFGLAGQFGYGVVSVTSFAGASLLMSARIGIYALIEGMLKIASNGDVEPVYLRGVVGVLAEVRISATIWCLSLQAIVAANAEVEVEHDFGTASLKSNGTNDVKALCLYRYMTASQTTKALQELNSKPVSVRLDQTMTARVTLAFVITFSASIDLGICKISKVFSQTLSTTVSTVFDFS